MEARLLTGETHTDHSSVLYVLLPLLLPCYGLMAALGKYEQK